MPGKQKFYVVWKGRKTGIFATWEQCALQVQGYPGAQYKSFNSRHAAGQALREKYSSHVGKQGSGSEWLFAPNPPRAGSLVVDAACSSRTKRLEYRGVELASGRELFHEGPYLNGTNNIGEFLAIVHALAMLAGKDGKKAIYSDSGTAIAWVKARHCNTDLAPDGKNAPLFELVRHAEHWLADHREHNPVLKWDTRAWGENPADFNRK